MANFQVFILTSVGYLLYQERVSWLFIVSIPLAFAGLFLVIGLDTPELDRNFLLGLGYGFATACFYSVFMLILRKLQASEPEFSLFYYLMVLSIATAVFLGVKVGVSDESFAIPNLKTWAALLGLGLFSQTLAWGSISNALPKVKASLAGLILLLQPALSFAWDVLLFDRHTGLMGWIGVTIVLAAIYLGTLKTDQPSSVKRG
jgi:drug/metabolite transporter (DMT)-like permease